MVGFKQVSGNASGEDGTLVVEGAGTRRSVVLVLDDTNWIIERATSKRSNKATRAKVPFAGETEPMILEANQELYVFARLNPNGGAGTQWDLSVVVTDAG